VATRPCSSLSTARFGGSSHIGERAIDAFEAGIDVPLSLVQVVEPSSFAHSSG